ncbi:MAG: hypothetical protein ABI646_11130, partial [Acidobacteriota bacterium]
SIYSDLTKLYSVVIRAQKALIATLVLLAFAVCGGLNAFAQQPAGKSQEISDVDGQPVLIKHLPDYEKVQVGAVFGTAKADLEKSIGNHGSLQLLDFPAGTEYVTATYPQGRLLIVEYTNPQSSLDADAKILQYIASHPESSTIYRRIGNYNAFVFDASDATAAAALLDQVKYEKTIQWLGEDPYILKRLERYMVTTSRDVMISTVLVIVGGLAASVLAGIVVGFIFFRVREQKRAHRSTFSDAGGLTRLNLDGLSE